ncbi:sodium:solute symporter [Halomonas sp. MCCC 1A17488]|uniref:sodium:solute symporter family transporter n=1 Tax=unclassified Halomonas TaxID=2609666 RepID=UPI0018D1FCD6|nr:MULTISPECIES: sodium:solute symporter [unclassified Halomonas]MCE8017671.1 sodium:solute symporter [Halomonas sp. MCCC 1A17488]MCG3241004.1 sodium:solute symporter [Halomonas sp. MCCC 1A17488]QPP48870.1 sodium:solute symporter [Halomonas sp. SS10-MC5]
MFYLTSAVLGAALLCFAFLGLRARRADGPLDDYVTARNSQSAATLGLSFLASGMGAWILFAPPEIGAFVGPVALAGYAIGSALPFIVLGLYGPAIRRQLPEGRSIGEFAEACYGTGVRRWVALVSVLYMACFLAAELTAIGAITALLSEVPPALVVIGVAATTLLYTAIGGLRASLATDRWQAWLLIALLLIVGGVALVRLPEMPVGAALPSIPVDGALGVALTLVIAVTAANLFHQGYWQRVWAARDERALHRGAWLGGATTVAVVALVGGLGMLAAMSGLTLGEPPMPFFALLGEAPGWLALPALVLAVTLVASSVDTLQNGIASLVVAGSGRRGLSIGAARLVSVALMVPVVIVALQGLSVLRLFLIADLLCAAIVVPVLLGLWRRMTPLAAMAGGMAGLLGAILPGWVAQGSLAAGVLAASFPGSIPTLPPFLGALAASTLVSLAVASAAPHERARPL